jgi:AcrR family transcriptional regulator
MVYIIVQQMNTRSLNDVRVQSPLRERLKQATRDGILQAAEAVFAARGFGGARMEEIAERAGVAVGTLYNYFQDRRAILEAVLEASAQQLSARMREGALPPSAPFPDQLERFMRIALDEIEAHFRFHAMLVEEDLGAARAATRRKRPAMLRVLYAHAERLVAQAVRDGALRPEDAELYPALLVGVMRGMFMRQLCADERRPLASHLGAMTRFFLEGAGRRGS